MQRSCEGGAYMIMLNHACLANADTPRCFEAESYPTCRPRWPTACRERRRLAGPRESPGREVEAQDVNNALGSPPLTRSLQYTVIAAL